MTNNSYYVPHVIEKTGNGERAVDIYSRLLKDRIVLLSSPVDDQVSSSVIAQLLFLQADNSKQDIKLFINSPGGSVTAGLAIYDTMKMLKCDIQTTCVGQAASMGAVLLSAGTKGKRFCLPYSRVMIHQPWGGVQGTSIDINIQAQEIERLKHDLYTILSENCDKTIKQITKDCDRDYFMSAKEAVDYKIVDKTL